MKHLSSFNNFNDDVKSSFLELKDLGFTIYSKEDILIKRGEGSLSSADEFVIYKIGRSDSGYTINSRDIDLFNIEDTMEYIIRFSDMCKMNNLKYRIITSDGEFTADITNKLDNLESINEDDIIGRTHLNFKKKEYGSSFDFKNLKFVSCQVFK